MKKFRLCTFLSLIFLSFFCVKPCAAEELQIVFPKAIYTGDTVEIRYIFHSDANLFSDELFNQTVARITLSSEYHFFESQKENFALKDAFLEKNGPDYTLSLKVIPWKSGYLLIPPFDLTSLVRYSQKMAGNGRPFIISLKPVQVLSLVERLKDNRFRPASAPKVMPGTTALLVFMGIFYLLLISGAFFALLKIPAISRTLEKISYLLSLKRNSRKTIKKLLSLLHNSQKFDSDKDFARELQMVTREFLNKRFARDFDSISTAALYSEFLDIACGELSEAQDEAVEILTEIFFRTDYIRYSGNSDFENGEKELLIEKAVRMIEKFDCEEEKDAHGSDANHGRRA